MGECSLQFKRERRIRRCHSKVAFPDSHIDIYATLHKQYKYYCNVCKHWHLTSREAYDTPISGTERACY